MHSSVTYPTNPAQMLLPKDNFENWCTRINQINGMIHFKPLPIPKSS